MGSCEVDLFASRLTRQLPRVFSWRPDPELEKVDAFNQDWSQLKGFCQLPMMFDSLLPGSSKEAENHRNNDYPIMDHSTIWWYPVLLGLVEDFPIFLPQMDNLVRLPMAQEFVMKQGVPDLVVWPISGNPLHHKAFLQKLQSSFCHHGGQRPNQITTHCLQDGPIGVSKGIEIPLLAQ